MLLTLAVRSLQRLIADNGSSELTLCDVPAFAIRELELHALNLPASMLRGWSLEDLDKLRDHADKAACPCLILVEDTGLAFGDPDPRKRLDAAERLKRLAVAANRLGCNAIAIHCAAAETQEALDTVVTEVRHVMPAIERAELNLLIAPSSGLAGNPDHLTDLIKQIGGFRIGSLPTFVHASDSGQYANTLRKLAPYAGGIHATVLAFAKNGSHEGYDLADGVKAIRSVGFVNTLAIDYTGDGEPIDNIIMARQLLQKAIDADSD
jgi:sugar phosphate isomerase/epimerase